jgi:sphingomyelin phosphodiesterase acid-like 3
LNLSIEVLPRMFLSRPVSLALLLLSLSVVPACQAKSNPGKTADVLMLSDIHLDPFHDPGKFARLRKASVNDWQDILDEAYSPTQAADFAKLQATCGAKGVDTPIELLESTLAAARKQNPDPLFITLSGDLMAHQFDCRFRTLAPQATPAEYSAFAAKTVDFVALMLWKSFQNTPIYVALGNNDSSCQDYREDPNSSFLKADAHSFAASTKTPASRFAVLKEFSQYGDYSVSLPMKNARLIVLQDIFEAKKYTSCGGVAGDAAAKAQIAWLRTQLAAARKSHENVWVMAHMPPGIDAYSTFTKHRDICSGVAPDQFLGSNDLAQAISDYGDVIRLALFGHTHMDEFRVYPISPGLASQSGFVPGKLVPSVSPVNGNNPAFTIAKVDPATATLKDYTVYAANNQVGIGTTWSEEYRYSTTYNQPDLSGASLAKITSDFVADKTGSAPPSLAYERYFFVGDPLSNASSKGGMKAAIMQAVWPTYACSMSQSDPAAFRACVCPAN